MRFGEVVPLDRNCGHKGPARQGGFRQPAVPRRPREADPQGCGREAPARQGTGSLLPRGIRQVSVPLHWDGEGPLPEGAFKIIVFDGKEAYIGSSNLTGAGMGMKSGRRRNFEAGILTDDPALVAAAMDHFDSVWAGFRCKDCGRKEYCGDPIVK